MKKTRRTLTVLLALLMLSGHVKKLAIEVDQAEKDGTI